MDNASYNEYFLFFRKSNGKLKERLFSHAKKKDIDSYSFIFLPVRLPKKPNDDNEEGSLKKINEIRSKEELFKFAKEIMVNINEDSHRVIKLPAEDSESLIKRGFSLQLFPWTVVKEIVKNLPSNWKPYIDSDADLHNKIEEITADPTTDEYWDQAAKLIISENSSWPNNIVSDPATYVWIIFRTHLFDYQIEIKYGEHILLDDAFFNEKLEYLIEFLKAYYEELKDDLII